MIQDRAILTMANRRLWFIDWRYFQWPWRTHNPHFK